MDSSSLPIAVIGAGPVGLAAAAELVGRGLPFVILEAGEQAGAAVRRWGHVKLFSPWRYSIAPAAARLLEATDWTAPDPEAYPSGAELVEHYLQPLAALPEISANLHLGTRVEAITRAGFDKMKTAGREDAPFVLHSSGADGEDTILARAVIDASGTYHLPNPLGASGVPAPGERGLAARISYGIPDVLNRDRERYAGKRVLVVGSGHSAFNALLDLAKLAIEEPSTRILWAIRRGSTGNLYGGGSADQLPERAEHGAAIAALVDSGTVQLFTGFKTRRVRGTGDGVVLDGDGSSLPPVDEIIGATGFRPDLDILRELRLDLDPAVESPAALATLIDPNVHSCGTVPPHGVRELAHPEANFYLAGMKSYGRAPTFLMLTGYEQVRSIVAALAGDRAAAEQVELVLPETGVCSTDRAGGGSCCGTSVAENVAEPIALLPQRLGGKQLITLTPAGTAPRATAQDGSCCGGSGSDSGCCG